MIEWSDAVRILQDIDEAVDEDHELEILQRGFYQAALRYGLMRAESALASEGRRSKYPGLTIALDELVDAVNVLSQQMKAHGKNTAWREALRNDRFDIDDLGSFCVTILGICGAHPSRPYCG